jgi:hypothetical protein
MTLQLPHVAAAEAMTSTLVPESASFDERWAAWQKKGAAHDRANRRKWALAAPVATVVIAVIVYALVGR